MLPNRTRSSFFAGLLLLIATLPAAGNDIRDMQLWAPAETGPYGNGPQPAEGFFFTFDQMFWNISRPNTQVIGRPGATREVWNGPFAGDFFIERNTHDTSLLRSSALTGSQRFEVGRILDRWGWFVSTYNLHSQDQDMVFNDVDVVFADPEYQVGGDPPRRFLQGYYLLDPATLSGLLDLPVHFDRMLVTNRAKHWNVELNMLLRTEQLHHGGFLEFFAGARYLEFQDQFMIQTYTDSLIDGSLLNALDNSHWDTQADNNVIGPQVGMRWFRQTGRWRVSGEGRFFAGINNQSVTQTGVLGSELDPYTTVAGRPASVGPQGFSHRETAVEFSPAWEVRCNLHYQFTRAVSFKVGWTGFWIDSVARASGLVDYQVNHLSNASMGIDMANNRQSVFIHGMNIGFEVNR